MTGIATHDLKGQSCEATGHPDDCTEPMPGSIQGPNRSVTVVNASGEEQPIATESSTLHFDSHSHDYSEAEGCHDDQSHDLTGSDLSNLSSSININGEPVILVKDNVATDPGTGAPVNVVSGGISTSLGDGT